MTTTDTTKAPRALPWLKYSADVDAQIAAGMAREQAQGGTTSYRDPERYTVGYGGERTYTQPASRPTAVVNGASDKQKSLIDKLLTEKVHSYTEAEVVEAKADRRLTRKMIDTLLDPNKCPRRPYQSSVVVEEPVRARLNFAEILDGNYAIRVDGVVKFYRVSTSKNGFKNVQVRASDSLFMQYGKAGIAILHRIVEAGLAESRMLFVTELDRCCKCGRSLTDEESRSNAQVNGGYGPDCALSS